jgi:hypothetical protein
MKKENKTIIIITLLLSIMILTQINLANSAPCNTGDTGRCGQTINTKGHGAVELCNNCFACGEIDGVCPAWYSVGDVSGDDLIVDMKIRHDVPYRLSTPDDYVFMYTTGDDACNYFNADFKEAQTRAEETNSWTTNPVITGTTDISIIGYDSLYVRAVCENATKRPSCDECVDPDCTTELRGVTYKIGTGGNPEAVEDVNITIIPQISNTRNNASYMFSVLSDNQGQYDMNDAYSGEVSIRCTKESYDWVEKNVTLVPGKNIIDCQMKRAECRDDCTLPSAIYGERICAAECDGIGGCNFPTTPFSFIDACDARPLNFFQPVTTVINETLGTITEVGARCCTTLENRTYSLFNIDDNDDVSRLITRSYNKILQDGTPVFLNIIVYNK